MATLEPRTRAEFVADELRRQITTGELPAGTRLRQVEIAQQFAVSTTPVREAFTSLAREGLVRQDAHKGVLVFVPSLDDLRENYEIRLALEPLAAELAARAMTVEQLRGIEQLLESMRGPVGELEGIELNRDFHRAIYAAADRPLLLQMIERLRASAEAYVRLLNSKPPPSYYKTVRAEHAAIVDALRAKAPKRARQAMAAHLQHNHEVISQLLPH